jgi:hypothetical protein
MFDFVTPTRLIVLAYVLLAFVLIALIGLSHGVSLVAENNLRAVTAKMRHVQDVLNGNQILLRNITAAANEQQEKVAALMTIIKDMHTLAMMAESNTSQVLNLLSGAERRALLRPTLEPILRDIEAKLGRTSQRVEHGITMSTYTLNSGSSARKEFSTALTIIADKLGVDVSGKPVPAKPTVHCAEYD